MRVTIIIYFFVITNLSANKYFTVTLDSTLKNTITELIYYTNNFEIEIIDISNFAFQSSNKVTFKANGFLQFRFKINQTNDLIALYIDDRVDSLRLEYVGYQLYYSFNSEDLELDNSLFKHATSQSLNQYIENSSLIKDLTLASSPTELSQKIDDFINQKTGLNEMNNGFLKQYIYELFRANITSQINTNLSKYINELQLRSFNENQLVHINEVSSKQLIYNQATSLLLSKFFIYISFNPDLDTKFKFSCSSHDFELDGLFTFILTSKDHRIQDKEIFFSIALHNYITTFKAVPIYFEEPLNYFKCNFPNSKFVGIFDALLD